jgi:hypothetical protein
MWWRPPGDKGYFGFFLANRWFFPKRCHSGLFIGKGHLGSQFCASHCTLQILKDQLQAKNLRGLPLVHLRCLALRLSVRHQILTVQRKRDMSTSRTRHARPGPQ